MTVASTQTETPLLGFVGEVLERLGSCVLDVEQCETRRGIARIDPARTVEAAAEMLSMTGSRLATATGIEVRDGIDVLYHWCFEPPGAVVTLKVLAERPALALESTANAVAAANWIEREIHDLLGVNFQDHPDMRRLILDDSWPEGVYPLRRDFDQVADRPPLPPTQSPPEANAGDAQGRDGL
jgi:NADH-quinone oxidoreductase subunit C